MTKKSWADYEPTERLPRALPPVEQRPRDARPMKTILTSQDIAEADDYIGNNPFHGLASYRADMAAFLNRRIEQRFNHRWRRYGLALEGFGMTGVAIGVLMLWSPGQTVEGILSTVLGFVVGIVGHGMGEPR